VAGVTPDRSTPIRGGSCEVAELFSAYLDGELQPGELDRVAAHLATCLDCIAEFRRVKEMRAALRMLPRLELPEFLMPESHHGAALSAYLDGELPTAEHASLHHHVSDCSQCRAELHELDAARTAIRSLPGLEPPEFLRVRRGTDSTHRRGLRKWQVATIAASAAAIVAIGAGALRSSGPEPSMDFDALSDRHIARASVEAGFTVVPAAGTFGGAP
jgi:anti-sigma factor RsiW